MPTAAQVGADPAGAATSAVTTHESALDPHPQYTTAAEAAAAAPVQTVAGRTGNVTLATADVAGAVDTSDARLSDARTPTAHTHPLSDLTQSGATTNQVPQWNGTAWVPATVSGGGGGAWGSITGTLSAQTDLQSALDGKATSAQGAKADSALQPNAPITGATKTKITYDADGLVTAGADATTADIADSTNKRYVTDAQLVVIGNTSGTNTGDQTSVTGNAGTATALQNARNIGGIAFNGSANIEPSVSEVSRTTSWTLGLSDRNTLQVQTHASPQTCTIPPQSSVTWVGPTTILILSHGSGTLTLDADTGVTLNGVSGGSVALDKYQTAVLRWISSDVWVVSGTSADVA